MKVNDKKCTKCGEVKSLDEFYKRPDRVNSYLSFCKNCNNNKRKNYYKTNRQHLYERGLSQARDSSTKKCTKCGKVKNLDNFHKHFRGPAGHTSECKNCHNARSSQYTRNRRAQETLRLKLWRKENPEKAKASSKFWYMKTPLQQKARRDVRDARIRGVVNNKPCEVCLKLYNIERKGAAHHCDYSQSLDLFWLCAFHHKAWHRVFSVEGV